MKYKQFLIRLIGPACIMVSPDIYAVEDNVGIGELMHGAALVASEGIGRMFNLMFGVIGIYMVGASLTGLKTNRATGEPIGKHIGGIVLGSLLLSMAVIISGIQISIFGEETEYTDEMLSDIFGVYD